MQSGLFDIAFDKGMRADRDLGIRLYLNGFLLLLDPSNVVLHHKAKDGGLRTHNQRKITFFGSRQKITILHIPSVSEFYLSRRYFSTKQNREIFWLAIIGTFAYHGNKIKGVFQIIFSLLMLPRTIWIINKRRKEAEEMLDNFPIIPSLPTKKN